MSTDQVRRFVNPLTSGDNFEEEDFDQYSVDADEDEDEDTDIKTGLSPTVAAQRLLDEGPN